ncbi:DNA polymerase III subunit beta [Thermus islandicus]|uniref:DNA polymerase III subunit beta n=1 Tax=Thermus islandicus TaxID=540988 RepID=UPI0003B488A5|nr:DNA polymerase III subunit beta [Thermus islandicus]
MRIQAELKSVKKALNAVARAVPSRASNPVLTYFYLEAKGGELVLKGSNGEIDLKVSLPAQVEGEGALLLPREPFLSLVGSASGEVLTMERAERLKLRAGSLQADLAFASTEEYPVLSFREGGKKAALPREAFAQAVYQVRYAVSKEEYRGVFRGIQLEFREGGLKVVAADGYRLAWTALDHPFPFEATAVFPVLPLQEALQALEAGGEEVEIRFADGLLGLHSKGEALAVTANLYPMEGKYPDYERVVPKEFTAQVLVETQALREAVRRLEVLADSQNRRLDLALEGSRIRLSAAGDYGAGEEEVPARVEGALELSVNARYLLEALPKSAATLVRFSGPTTPFVVGPDGDESYQAVMAPLRV